MEQIMAGIITFFMSIGSFFQFGQAPAPQSTNLTTQLSTTPAAKIEEYAEKYKDVYKEGNKPFFGKVIEVKESEIIVQIPVNANNSTADSNNENNRLKVKIDDSTLLMGGKQSDITNSTNVAGIGKMNKDGSLTASKIQFKSK